MGAPDILGHLSSLGIRLDQEGPNLRATPRDALTDELRDLIKRHKSQLIDALATERRRERVLAMLADNPMLRLAVVADPDSNPAAVLVAVAIRDVGSCEVSIPRANWEPLAFLELVGRHGVIVQ